MKETTNGIINDSFRPADDEKASPLDAQYVKAATGDTGQESKAKKATDEAPPVSFFKLYTFSSGKDKIMIAIGVIAAIITGLCTPANTLIFGGLVDTMVTQASRGMEIEEWTPEDTAAMIEWFLGEVNHFVIYNSLLGVIMLVFTYISIMCFNYAAHSQIFRIRGAFLRSVLNQDIGWYDANQSGEFASRMNEDLSKLEEGLGEKVSIYLNYMVAFLGSIVLAFVKGWQLALVCLVSLPVTMASVGIVAVITSRLAKQEMEAYAKAGSIAEEVFAAIRTVVAFGGQQLEAARYKVNLVDARNINIRKGFFSGVGFGLLWFFIYASYALSFWYGVGLVLEHRTLPPDEVIYTPGIMFTVFFSVMMAGMNLGISSPFIEVFGVAKGAAAKVFQIIEQRPIIDPFAGDGKRPATAQGNVHFRNVHFQYPSRSDVKVLQGLNLTIRRGETVALVGPSGCGKSTCIQLMQRFYDPIDGQITFDGEDTRALNVNWLRSRIGVVGQEPILFNCSIHENIRYGYEEATNEEIEAAAKAANAHVFIKRLPNGYDTLVGERGAQMSGGQKQRIAIARALVRNPEILLLDEATSALDTASEAKVQAALEKASEGRTTIIVAHRLSTIRNADKICVLKDGCIVEEGSHKELMLLKGHYYSLVITQIGTSTFDENTAPTKTFVVADEDDGEVIAIGKELDVDEESDVSQIPFRQVMRWNATEWPLILVGCIASVLMGAAMPLFSLIFGEILGVLSHPDPEYVRSETDRFSLYFVATGVVSGVSTFLQIYTFGKAGEILTERVRGMAFVAMLRQDIAWFDDKNNGTGTLCARLSTDAAAVQGATGQRISTVIQSLSTLILAIGISMYYEWRLGLLALAFTPFILVSSYLEIKYMEEQNLGNARTLEKSTKLAVEVVSNIRTVVSLGREPMFHKMYMDVLAPSLRMAKRNTHVRAVVYGVARSLMYFAFAACMWYGGYLVANDGLFYATVFVVTQALIMGTMSIANALAFAPNFQKGLMAAGKINNLVERKPQIYDPPEIVKKNWTPYGDVLYYQTEFFYPSRPSSLVLRGLDLNAMQGQTIALVGASGCGKSTCIQLIERFYDATRGYIAIDDKDVTSVSLADLRAGLGIVSQEPSLFDRTIAENIAYGDNRRTVPHAEVIEAAKQANIHSFVTALPLGYETRMGINGTQLSGGQKQRIAIARALVRNPRILLLDEATSALDSESEKVVQDALDVAKEGRTCMTIAHRLTTIVGADRIFVINAGRVVEAGTHHELLALNGFYHNLFMLQG